MTHQEKARWLSEFYAQVVEGGAIQFYRQGSGWWMSPAGPNMKSDFTRWRIKPVPREWEGYFKGLNTGGDAIFYIDGPEPPFQETKVRIIEVLNDEYDE